MSPCLSGACRRRPGVCPCPRSNRPIFEQDPVMMISSHGDGECLRVTVRTSKLRARLESLICFIYLFDGQGCSRWLYPCCVSQHRSSCIFGRKKGMPSEPPFQWRASSRCFPYYISCPLSGEVGVPKGFAACPLPLVKVVWMVPMATFCLPLWPFPQQSTHCVPRPR